MNWISLSEIRHAIGRNSTSFVSYDQPCWSTQAMISLLDLHKLWSALLIYTFLQGAVINSPLHKTFLVINISLRKTGHETLQIFVIWNFYTAYGGASSHVENQIGVLPGGHLQYPPQQTTADPGQFSLQNRMFELTKLQKKFNPRLLRSLGSEAQKVQGYKWY